MTLSLGHDFFARVRVVAAVFGLIAVVAPSRPALAGCNDGACGRVDWTEVTDMRQGEPVAAKLHGGFAWEASPDFWSTHPMGGEFEGFLWVTCIAANGTLDSGCMPVLSASLANVGTSMPVVFSGTYYDSAASQTLQPPGLFKADASGQPVYYTEVGLGSHGPLNPNVCPAAFALGRDSDAGGAVTDVTRPDGGAMPGIGGAGQSGGAGPTGSAGSGSSTASQPGGATPTAVSRHSADASATDAGGSAGSGHASQGSCSISDRPRHRASSAFAFGLGLSVSLTARRRIRLRCTG